MNFFIFIGFSLATDSIDTVRMGYMKMKLCHPKARHIICAFHIPGEEWHKSRGYCDDVEHGAGTKLLNFLIRNNMQCRVVFVVRYYSSKKIGKNRFTCIENALRTCLETYPLNEVLGCAQELLSEDEYDPESEYETGIKEDDTKKGSNTVKKDVRYKQTKVYDSYSQVARKLPNL